MLKYKKNKVINFRMLQQKYKIMHNQNRKKNTRNYIFKGRKHKERNISQESFK